MENPIASLLYCALKGDQKGIKRYAGWIAQDTPDRALADRLKAIVANHEALGGPAVLDERDPIAELVASLGTPNQIKDPKWASSEQS